MKYIMFKRKTKGLTHYLPVVFPNQVVHADMAAACEASPAFKGYRVHSAGEFTPMSCECSGRSDTLGVESGPQDSRRILLNDYGACIE